MIVAIADVTDMAHYKRKPRSSPTQVAADDFVARARRLRRRGEHRRAMFILQAACFLAREDARLWTLYAAQCERAGRVTDALEAYHHALWLRERESDPRRALSLRRVVERVRARAA